MSIDTPSELERLVLGGADPVGAAATALLAWVAHANGEAHPEATSLLEQFGAARLASADTAAAVRIGAAGDVDAIQLASELARACLTGAGHELLVRLAIGVALVDRRLTTIENHTLRFVADALGVTPDRLLALFEESVGHPMPAPGDPSRAAFWESASDAPPPTPEPREPSDHEVLGVAPGASAAEIRAAWRRQARVHHPDRFAGADAVGLARATEAFQRVERAYRTLSAGA